MQTTYEVVRLPTPVTCDYCGKHMARFGVRNLPPDPHAAPVAICGTCALVGDQSATMPKWRAVCHTIAESEASK